MKLTTQQKILIMQYVLDSISFDGLGYDTTDYVAQNRLTAMQAYRCKIAGGLKLDNITMLRATLINEMGTTKQRQGLNITSDYYYVARLADFLQGLPSYLAIAFSNFEILELGNKWGIDLETETSQDVWLEQYWLEIAKATHNLGKLS